ncbi:hypothetical protein GA0116948_10655 [Chitinophaga costaii]|uniref:Uncharacterized protein n=1 Tax=Chitinophaga costaii TaxID=1335309 RepID=A0A1C4DR45_9BACT|nr:hypothetical protein GA0116948_10655 [Chitinophaga costaii]
MVAFTGKHFAVWLHDYMRAAGYSWKYTRFTR